MAVVARNFVLAATAAGWTLLLVASGCGFDAVGLLDPPAEATARGLVDAAAGDPTDDPVSLEVGVVVDAGVETGPPPPGLCDDPAIVLCVRFDGSAVDGAHGQAIADEPPALHVVRARRSVTSFSFLQIQRVIRASERAFHPKGAPHAHAQDRRRHVRHRSLRHRRVLRAIRPPPPGPSAPAPPFRRPEEAPRPSTRRRSEARTAVPPRPLRTSVPRRPRAAPRMLPRTPTTTPSSAALRSATSSSSRSRRAPRSTSDRSSRSTTRSPRAPPRFARSAAAEASTRSSSRTRAPSPCSCSPAPS